MSQQTLRQFLLVRSQQPENEFGPCLQEILKAEGLNGFTVLDLDNEPWPEWRAGDIAILTRCLITAAETTALFEAVEHGLRLVTIQPPLNVAWRLGWKSQRNVVHPGWVQVREGYPGGGYALQTHVPITRYIAGEEMGDFVTVADAVNADWSPIDAPAVVKQRVGDGEVVSFFYDLPKAIARIRFGDPELASYLTNGNWDFLHALDMFGGHVDERMLDLPQAEIHAQLLAKVVTDISPYPLPRLWYYERPEHRAAANFSSDDDWSKPEQFQDLSDSLIARGGRATFYLVDDTLLPDEKVEYYRGLGHTFGPHVNAMRPKEDWEFNFPSQVEKETNDFKARYDGGSLSLQCHCAPWRGYSFHLPVYMANGYRLLYSFLSHPTWLNKYMCGAGRPLKFISERGEVYDCWQQPMTTYDDQSLIPLITNNAPEVVAQFAEMLIPVLGKTHTAIGIGSHPVSFSTYSKPFLTGCWDELQREGVPIYSGDDWCLFSDRRHAVEMSCANAASSGMKISLTNVATSLSLMIPLAEDAEARVLVNGEAVPTFRYRRLEQDYLFVALEASPDHGTIEMDVAY